MGRTRQIPFDAEPPLPGETAPDLPRISVPPDQTLWVFGYGSLMWDPGFPFMRRAPARLWGYHRAFCIWSHRYRGTPEAPGLVLGLKPGGSCLGVAFEVAADDHEPVIDYLYRREMLTGVYRPGLHNAEIDGRRCLALAFVADHRHRQFAGGLSPRQVVEVIGTRHGQRGANAEYLANTVLHLDELGISDGPLHALLEEVRSFQRRGRG